MTNEYLCPERGAVEQVNRMFNLPATGKEQDWELELSDPDRLDEMLDALEQANLDLETKSALALLVIASIEDGDETEKPVAAHIARMREVLRNDRIVNDRMRYYWLRNGGGERYGEWSKLLFG